MLCNKLSEKLGADRLSNDTETLERYGSSLSGSPLTPLCVVFPRSTIEVCEVVSLVNAHGGSIHAISRGKNYGYGDAQGTKVGQVILDLSRMNKVLEVSQELCFIRLQAGVSQGELYSYLQSLPSNRLQLDITAAGTNASIVGNILERGYGHTEYGDRFSRVVNMTVVLPNAKVIQTGLGAYHQANAVNVFRYGAGPAIDGLFTQANFGIVTEMVIEAMPKTELTSIFVFSSDKEEAISSVIPVIRELRLFSVVNSAVHIANKARTVGKSDNSLVGAWNICGSISGPKSLVAVKKKLIKKEFGKHLSDYKLRFADPWLLKSCEWVHTNIKELSFYPTLRDMFDLLEGIPTNESIKTLFDNSKLCSHGELSLLEFPKGLRWICATCRADSSSVTKLVELLTGLFEEEGYEFRITFTFVSPRALVAISNILFDRDLESVERAVGFYEKCMSMLAEYGYYPYRSGSGMYKGVVQDETTREFLQTIKTAVDPSQVLSPGKYNI